MEHSFLIHHGGDHVGVAVLDIPAGMQVRGVYMDSGESVTITTSTPIPLGHKVALARLDEGADVLKYGVRIGRATAPIDRGDYVHTHNLRSARW